MLIDGQKWACEACIRGHRVTSCRHHDRPLIQIKRKGRPFALCTICNATPCAAPIEHARAKREAELNSPSKKASNHGRLFPRHHNPDGFLTIAPRPGPRSLKPSSCPNDKAGTAGTSLKPRSESNSGQSSEPPRPSRSVSSASSGETHVFHDATGAGDWSGSEGSLSVNDPRQMAFFAASRTHESTKTLSVAHDSAVSRSAPESLYACPIVSGAEATAAAAALFDPTYPLLPSTPAVSDAQLVPTLPVSPLEGVDPFGTPLDLGGGDLRPLEDFDLSMDMELPVVEEVFHVEDWSRYMWSAETGFEHLDTGFPPMSQ